MENRFMRGGTGVASGDAGLRAPDAARGGLFARDAGAKSYPSSIWAQPLSASNRTLVVLIENGGVDLGIPALVDKLLAQIPGADQIPAALRQQLVNFLRQKLIALTDNLIETAELSLNRYAAAKPELFGDVVVLRDGSASYQALKDQLFALTRAGKMIDLLILTHGNDDFISVTGGISGRRIRDMRTELGKPLSIRSVYMMNCVGSSLNQAWLDAGAKVSSGALRNNYLPEPTTFFFWKAWKEGQGFENAASSAYLKTIALMGGAVHDFLTELPMPLNMLANFVNFSGMDFVKDSAPVIQGQGSVTIGSDDLVFSQSLARASSLATTVVPLRTLRALANAQSNADAGAAPAPTEISAQGIDFIKRWAGFHKTPYNDHGQCAVGYGTPLHAGACDGQSAEQPFAGGIQEAAATQLLMARLADAQRLIGEVVTVKLTQNQNDALLSFIYALGGKRFRHSTLLRVLNQGNFAEAAAEFGKWCKVHQDGVLLESPVVAQRRAAEAELFQKPGLVAMQSLSRDSYERYAAAMGGEIPLDPGAGGRSIDESALMTGDIIVSTTPANVSGLIRWATQSQVSHTMLYIGGGQVVEAVGDGVNLHSLADAVRDSSVAVAFRHPGLTPAQALVVRDFAGQQLGKPYNYWGIVRQGGFQLDRQTLCAGKSGADYDRCVNWAGRVNLGRGDDDSFFCSQLVVAAYQHAGVPLTSTPPIWNSPNDLAQLGMAKRLGYVGHLKAPVATAQSLSVAGALSLVNAVPRGRTVLTQTLASPMGFSAVEWEPLISFRPPAAIQKSVKGKGLGWHVHRLEDAQGDINLDYYPVSIATLPVVGGRTLTSAELLSHIRLNINKFVDTRISAFSPYDAGEAAVWSSSSPLGAVVHIEMKAANGWINPDDGSVVTSEVAADHWIFSTVWTVLDMAHPVSGNRQFGFSNDESGGLVFYTRGADRTTGLLDLAAMSMVYSAAHNLWLSFQQALAAFVNANGGSASIGTATSIRTPWPAIRAAHHHPSVGWV